MRLELEKEQRQRQRSGVTQAASCKIQRARLIYWQHARGNRQQLFIRSSRTLRVRGFLFFRLSRFIVKHLIRKFSGPGQISFANSRDHGVTLIRYLKHKSDALSARAIAFFFVVLRRQIKGLDKNRPRFRVFVRPQEICRASQYPDSFNRVGKRFCRSDLFLDNLNCAVAAAK